MPPFADRAKTVFATGLLMVPRAGVEPAQPKPRDFKSLVSTNFTTGAAQSGQL